MTDSGRLRVRAYYDFGSTLCYVAHRVFAELAPTFSALELELVWSPLDLSQLLGWRRRFPVDPVRLANAERVAAELRVNVRPLLVWPDSREANAAALVFARDARESAFRERVFSAVFEEGRELDAPGAVAGFARELGLELDPSALERARDELEFRTHVAAEEEVTGLPTLMLDEFPFGGIQSRETTRLVLERWAKRKRSALRAS